MTPRISQGFTERERIAAWAQIVRESPEWRTKFERTANPTCGFTTLKAQRFAKAVLARALGEQS